MSNSTTYQYKGTDLGHLVNESGEAGYFSLPVHTYRHTVLRTNISGHTWDTVDLRMG